MAACRAGLGGVRRVAGGAGEAVYGRVPALAGNVRICRTRRANGRGSSPGEGAGRYIGDASGTRRTGCSAGNIRTCGYGTRCTADSSTRPCLGARAAVRAGSGTVCRQHGTPGRRRAGRGGCGTRCNGSAGTSGRTTHAGWVRRIAVQCFRYADRTGAGAERTAGTGAYALRPVRVLSRRTQSGEPSQEARPET